jgi:hypothetical protein
MAKITNLLVRCTCAHCGKRAAYEFRSDEDTRVALPQSALWAGWVSLGGPRMFLCPMHAEAVKRDTVEEIKFLEMRLVAFERAALFHLPFIVLGKHILSEGEDRLATAAEIAMWQVLTGAVPFKVPGES